MLEILLKVKAQIESPTAWTEKYFCRDYWEIPCADVCGKNVCKWSLRGAVELHTWEAMLPLHVRRSVLELLRASGSLDPKTHAEAMQTLDRAIAKL